MSPAPLSMGYIYRWPLLIGVITSAGLLFALLGDGVWDAISWVLLFLPIGIVLRKLIPSPSL